MASQQPPPPSESPPPAPTTISAIGDDLLLEILLRLPSLPSLVRAALTCRAFLRAVRSSRPFRRRFRAVHEPPLLGLFFDPDGPAIPTFAPLRRRSDPDLAAAVRGADFFLTRLPDYDDAAPGWEIRDCSGGYLVLTNWGSRQIAVYNPLARALDLLPPQPDDEISDGCIGYFTFLDCHIVVFSDDEPGPFRVFFTCHDESRARAAVFSSDSREWRVLPWAPAAMTQPEDDKYWLHSGELVDGSIYWTHTSQACMLVLDTAAMRFSRIDIPPYLKGKGHTFRPGETKDGKLCIVCAIEFTLVVWNWRADDDGTDQWMLDRMYPLHTEIVEATEGSLVDHAELKVFKTMEGIVYLSTCETFNDPDALSWFMSFCLETGKLKKLFQKKFDCHIHPYIMAWPPLVGNNADPLLEDS